VIDESDLQYEKQDDPRISTFLGIKIDWSDENENAYDSIRVNREFDSKIMNWSFLYPLRITIEFGIQEREISGRFQGDAVTVLTEPSSTTTRRCKNCVEFEKPILCFDWREDNMKVKWFESVGNIEWLKEKLVRWQSIKPDQQIECSSVWNWGERVIFERKEASCQVISTYQDISVRNMSNKFRAK
jgi:hypothetical protein